MRPTRVLKFGGAALADGPAVRAVCEIVAACRARDGAGPVVVVSAHRGVTDQLEALGHAAAAATGAPERLEVGSVRVRHRSLLAQLELPSDLLDRYWRALSALLEGIAERGRLEPAELDRILSFGERLSTRIVARALARHGVPATPVDAWDLGLVTDSRHGRARPLAGRAEAIRAATAEVPGVPVVTGFLAKDQRGRLTTLGRDGSDLTAAILAEAVDATELVYWKDVPGILSADPRLVPDARLLSRVSYDMADELALHGARVLHPGAVAPARRAGVDVRVACVHDPEAPGTALGEEDPGGGARGLATREDLLVLRLEQAGPEGIAGLTATLEAGGVTVRACGVAGDALEALVDGHPGLPSVLTELGPKASVQRDLASLALVGAEVGRDPNLARAARQALEDAGVSPRPVPLEERAGSLVFVVPTPDLAAAAGALHCLLPAPAALRN